MLWRMTTNTELLLRVVESLPLLSTRAETADFLRCQPNFISQLIQDGELSAFQRRATAGSRILIPRDSIASYLERSAVQ
jgi:hypothetical protein